MAVPYQKALLLFAFSLSGSGALQAIDIVLDFSLDDQNAGWFSGTSEGLARRAALDSAAAFWSAVITNDDWNSLSSLDQTISFSDVAASSWYDLDGNLVQGEPDSDGLGYSYSFETSNRSGVGANEYIIYVGAFEFDPGTSAHAKGGWSSSGSSRNAAGVAGTEFNTWGGRIYFDMGQSWYTGQNPGVDPTDDYGIQDPNKTPTTDIQTDNWDWSTGSDTWKGFDLRSVDASASGKADLYAVGLHEMMHALGATSSNINSFLDVMDGNAHGANVVAEFGGPVPLSSTGGHFASDVQSEVWDSDGIISEALLDPNSTNGARKYATKLDVALLRDLGYDVVASLSTSLAGDFDQDDDVDGADFLQWQLGGSPDPLSMDDLAQWQSAYHATSESLRASIAVPEPQAALLAALSVVGGVLCRRTLRRG